MTKEQEPETCLEKKRELAARGIRRLTFTKRSRSASDRVRSGEEPLQPLEHEDCHSFEATQCFRFLQKTKELSADFSCALNLQNTEFHMLRTKNP